MDRVHSSSMAKKAFSVVRSVDVAIQLVDPWSEFPPGGAVALTPGPPPCELAIARASSANEEIRCPQARQDCSHRCTYQVRSRLPTNSVRVHAFPSTAQRSFDAIIRNEQLHTGFSTRPAGQRFFRPFRIEAERRSRSEQGPWTLRSCSGTKPSRGRSSTAAVR
jgi:hypothetical protein